MPKKLHKKHSVAKVSTKERKKYTRRGKANLGVMAALGVIVGLSLSLVFGMQRLSTYDSQTASGYSCCDSGNGGQCEPTGTKITVNGIEYQKLKTGIKFKEGPGHLQPDNTNVSGLSAGQYVYLNATDKQDYWKRYNCDVHGPTPASGNMDTLASGQTSGSRCEAIPNDEVVYVCTSGCDGNRVQGDNAVFDAYFRLSDMPPAGPGIPDSIKNCQPPSEAQVQQGQQHIILLPSPTGQPNLQLETFYIKQDQVVADWVSPYCKPAVYLYPTEKTAVHVQVNPQGKMLVTTPAYQPGGWNVTAYPNGDILENGSHFDYLFYEASLPDDSIVLPKEGYVIAYDSLNTFLPELVTKLGLNGKETVQFADYWLHALPKSPYYQIKIVTQDTLNKLSPLTVYPSPKTVIRVTLHFTPLDKKIALPLPKVVSPTRNGFTVVEWGGIFKRDASHPFSCFM